MGGLDNTVSIDCTVDNDALKVQAILNQIDGKTSDGTNVGGVPNVFGMNFQAVSVGQKLAKSNHVSVTTPPTPSCQDHKSGLDGQPGGYLRRRRDAEPVLDYGLNKTDAALGAMIAALKTRSTL